MITQILQCPNCHGTDIVNMASLQKSSAINVERLLWGRTFILDYAYSGQSRQVKQQIVDRAISF
jgi:hypothetical protein